MDVANTLAYNNKTTITIVKSFILQALLGIFNQASYLSYIRCLYYKTFYSCNLQIFVIS